MNIIDLHCDTLSEILYGCERGENIALASNDLHISLEKMEKGGYALQTFASFVDLGSGVDPLVHCLKLIDIFNRETAANSDRITPVRSYVDIEAAMAQGKIAALLSIEEGGACRGEISVLRHMYTLGVRMMTLTWNYENELAYPNDTSYHEESRHLGIPDKERGLKDRGIEFLCEMERLGIIVDVSHLGDACFFDLVKHTTKPFIASHSNCRSLVNHCRNLTDDMIRAIAERGGVIGVNYWASVLEEVQNEPEARSRIEFMVAHMKHMKKIGGIDCIALGSDFDGITRNLEMYDASCLQNLCEGIVKGGFTEDEAEKICSGNALRLFKEILK